MTRIADLETVLTTRQVERGKDILLALGAQIVLTPTAQGLEAEIKESLQQAVATLGGPGAADVWLGIIRNLRTALLKAPLPAETVKVLLAEP